MKAYYRRGSAYMALAKYKLAVKDFRKVRVHSGSGSSSGLLKCWLQVFVSRNHLG